MKLDKKRSLLQKRRWRIRKKVKGTAERPRLAVHFSNKHIYAQCIDDLKGHTLAYVLLDWPRTATSRQMAKVLSELGKIVAEKAKTAGIETVVFDRAGRRYHGCVKSFAEAAREGGLQF